MGYAEAQNEASGPDPSVYEAVNKVRARSDIPNVKKGLNQKEMREVIHRERRIEFAFEGKRWFDLLRWKTASQNKF